jgi:peptidoglycan DL-endopeptidase CwlO
MTAPEPRRYRAGRRGRHAPLVIACALLASAVALALTATVAGRASAAPADAVLAARARTLQAELDRRHDTIERFTERVNATEEHRRQLGLAVDALRQRQQAAQAELETAQRQLNEGARAVYMHGPQWLLAELFGDAGVRAEAGGSAPPQRAVLEALAGTVTEVGHRKAELDGLDERVGDDLAEAEQVHQRDLAEREQLQAAVDQLQAILDGIDERLGGYLEAEQARSEAARRAAWSGYMSGVGSVQAWLQAGPVARAAVRWALAQLGDPYRWGMTGPDSFDCSGLTSSAYRAAGVSIPRVSRAQWGAGPHVAFANLLPGDLIFYADNPGDPGTIHHVGMYIGNGLMVHAPHTGDVVRVASIWREGYAGATRIVPGVITPGLPGPPPTAPPPTSPTPPPPPPMTTSPPTTKPSPAPPTTRPPTSTSRATATTRAATTTTGATTTAAPPTTTTAPPTTTSEAPTTTAPPTTSAAEPPATEATTTTAPPATS